MTSISQKIRRILLVDATVLLTLMCEIFSVIISFRTLIEEQLKA